MTPYSPHTFPGAGALDLEVSAADDALDHLIEDLETLRDWIRLGSRP